MTEQRLLNRDFILLICIGFCLVSSYLFLLISAAGYSEEVFGTSSSSSAVAVCTFLVGALAARTLFGPRIDALGRRKCLIAAGLFGFASCLLYVHCTDLLQFSLVRVLHGFCYGLGILCANSMVASVVPAERRAEGIGLFMLAFTLASAVGPYVSMNLEYGGDYGLIFNLAALCCLAPMVLALFLKSGGPVTYSGDAKSAGNGLFEPTAFRICLVLFVFGVSYASLLTFNTVYGEVTHLEYAMVNFYLVEAVATLLSRTVMAKIPDRYGDNISLIPCFVVYSASLFAFAYADSEWQVYFCGAAMGFMIAFMNSVGQSIAIRRVGPERYSVCISMFQNFYDLALAVGPIMLGLVADGYGYSAMYVVAGMISVMSMVMYVFLHGITGFRQGRRAA